MRMTVEQLDIIVRYPFADPHISLRQGDVTMRMTRKYGLNRNEFKVRQP